MGDIAITAHNLGKMYHIGARVDRYRTLRDSIASGVKAPFIKMARLLRGHASAAANLNETIWALRHASLEIRHGEVVGLIGRNGAGKSTLLKVLSRITEPTEGSATLYGRVGSLLEVGTGFHPELTGRENIFLNGAIIGMKRVEIASKFDEIVAFSELDTFIDTPVKHYSSGMYTRLAFAVAAHLETEILLVDEVLAVGDVSFQKKCMGKMSDVASQGRTVIFVSHNMGAIQTLCTRGVLLRGGEIVRDGAVDEIVQDYLSYLNEGAVDAFVNNPERQGAGNVKLTAARVLDDTGASNPHLVSGKPATFEFDYENASRLSQVDVVMTIYNYLGIAATSFNTRVSRTELSGLGETGTFRCHVPVLPLPLGQFRVAVAVHSNTATEDLIPNVLLFDVVSSTFYEGGGTPDPRYCTVMVQAHWDLRR
ncbi:MAG TPA: ABC transporter ATP-binding protein [Candidatus Hydrogenedentes bacterium]|nr:ABC transporter ATP-binding protein [Candidatus Hydrogenedentota bacterium]